MYEMKDSGVEWIGDIPEHWKCIKNKYVFNLHSGESLSKEMLIDGGKYAVYGGGEVIGHYNKYNVPEKSILIGRVGARCGCVTYLNQLSWATDNALIINAKQASKYIFFALISANLNRLNTSNAQPLITATKILNDFIVFPPVEEQQKIAAYLDSKCTDIDYIISGLKKQVETLEKYKKSLITETVTKGLNPDVRMKDSGVEWIGKVPEHWKIVPVKYFISITNGSDPLTKSGDTQVYGSGSRSFKTCEEYKQGPAVLLGRKGTINIPQWIEGKYWNIDTAFDAKPKNKNINLKLFYYHSVCFDYGKYSTQTTLPSMTQSDYNNMKIPVPPPEEQKAIADYLDEKCNAIDKSVEEKQALIEKLAQYKKSLIFEYVTGKRKV